MDGFSHLSSKDRKALRRSKGSLPRASVEAAEQALTALEASRYPRHQPALAAGWSEVIPFFAFPDEVRRIGYTTNAIEASSDKRSYLCRSTPVPTPAG